MTPAQAKKLTATKLAEMGLNYKLTAKTVSFADLARGEAIFVRIHDWKPSEAATVLEGYAKANGFIIEFY